MKIQYCSDLHLEFPENKATIKRTPPVPVGDILILAGDILPLFNVNEYDWFLDWVSDHFKMTYWIPGNHEYYDYSMEEKDLFVFEKIRSNIILLSNKSIEFGNYFIHFTTLWSEISAQWARTVEHGVSDFCCIKYKGNFLSANNFNYFHKVSKVFLEEAFHKSEGKENIVVSHHVPTFENYPKEFYGSTINMAFAVELRKSIEAWSPKYWIYGHIHRNIPPFKIGKTTLLTNQLGYVRLGEDADFVRNQMITL